MRPIDADKVLNIVAAYCPDDDGSCSKAGVDLREMLDEIEALPEIDAELIAHIHELEAENARLEEGYQKSLGVKAATDCVECQAWIDASIRQPDDDEGDVLVWYQCKCCGKTSQSWGISFYNRGDWYTKHLDGECINVLFWHKLPKPPTRGATLRRE